MVSDLVRRYNTLLRHNRAEFNSKYENAKRRENKKKNREKKFPPIDKLWTSRCARTYHFAFTNSTMRLSYLFSPFFPPLRQFNVCCNTLWTFVWFSFCMSSFRFSVNLKSITCGTFTNGILFFFIFFSFLCVIWSLTSLSQRSVRTVACNPSSARRIPQHKIPLDLCRKQI